MKRDPKNPESHVRDFCRKYFHSANLMKRIAVDLAWLFEEPENEQQEEKATGDLWNGKEGNIEGGVNYAEEADDDGSDCD